MPGNIDGFDVLEDVKKMDHNIKVITVTGFVESETEEECKKMGADAHIIKPIDFRKLADMIKEITERNKL